MFFPRIAPASDGMNEQSIMFFKRMVHAHPELAGYLHNTDNLSKIEDWVVRVAGLGMAEAYDIDVVTLLRIKGRVDIHETFVTLPRRALAWAYSFAIGVEGPDELDDADLNFYWYGPRSDDTRFITYFNFSMVAIDAVGGDLEAGGMSGFWKGFFTDAFVHRITDIVRGCPEDVNPIVFVQAVNSYGLDGAIALHRDGVPLDYIEALVA